MTPNEAWALLLAGNDRYRTGMATRTVGRARLTEHRPLAAVLACSDARAVPDDAFDAPPGSLFTVRTAGHTIDAGATGSLEYAIGHLGVGLIVVLGHTHCGAVAAAHAIWQGGELPPGRLGDVIGRLVPETAPAAMSPQELGEQHVLRCRERLIESSEPIAQAVAAGRLDVRAAQLRLEDGTVVALG